MSDYNKQTVAQLRQILKERGIPSTGLTRKAQIVEKLEEADSAGAAVSDAPPEPVEQVEPEAGQDAQTSQAQVPEPALPDAGEPKEHLSRETEPTTEAAVAPTSDRLPENVSHIDSDAPPPNTTRAMNRPAEDSTNAEEPGTIQPAGVFNAPPADPETVVEPMITDPKDQVMEDKEQEKLAADELPDAPGPAAEALRFAKQESDLSEDLKDPVSEDKDTPVSNEQPSVERTDALAFPEQSTQTSRLNTEELEADTKKRKRRSDSPDQPLQDIKAKKHRPSQDPAPEIHLREDEDVTMDQRRPEDNSDVTGIKEHTNGSHDVSAETESPALDVDTKREKKENVSRYKDLVKSSTVDTPMEAIIDDRPTIPALHPVTSALYIRNFMRPLRPEPLRTHLASLASPPSSSPDPSIIKSLFLDAMKTHALVSFTSTTAASRVRASLHGSIWPPEGNRKELWVDFIPSDSVESWIKAEEDAILADKEARANGRSAPTKRFEVVYSTSDDGSTTAIFQEVGSSAPSNAPRGPRASIDVQQHHSTSLPKQTSLPPTDSARPDITAPFKTLDELFESTTTKPQLFYLPVSDEISALRLKEFDAETSRDWAPGETRKGRGIKSEAKFKYSFDEEDRVVEVGEDRGPWSEGYAGRGGRRGRGGRGGGGGWRGRADVWRG
ncbi:hypothetical protein T440DRAFT_553473 [Plenodomus tracheiphilus IPT5]|uniref:SAP domain-containing protein n=1 Tax=Plenodomus tracheiphilus IPT5 TaxID=1408161 RepID=A0A6A7BAQ4_9PLEO|nr:hypothetical protein T440DRAFT_553473 [Plenodomus tracheiphilus IPT5]